MLQNPSKYHPNPLSHFLALHNSQAAHNARNNGNNNNNNGLSSNLVNATAFGLCGSHNNQFHTQQHTPHHQQQQQQEQLSHSLQQGQQQMQNQIYNQTHQQHQHQHQQQQHKHLNTAMTHAHQHAQFLDATGTTLDVGKSFTIAAILGLQNRNNNNNNISNINNNHSKDLTNAINLSLNGNQHGKSSTLTPATANAANANASANAVAIGVGVGATPTNQESASNRDSNMNAKAELIISAANKFHCDNNSGLINPYLSNANALTTSTTAAVTGSTAAFIASAAHQQHQLHQSQHHPLMASHVRANSFAAAAAVAAVAAANVSAVVNGAPSALQSLQQLHQHHAQQSSLTFARDKLKSENHSKKSSLKNKRVRTIFTPEQLERLEAEFERQQYMVGPERLYLAHTLQLTEAQVKVWFQNRRIKWRKHHLELTQQRLALLRQNQLQTGTVAANIGSLPSPDGLATVASNSSFDENDELNIKNEDMNQSDPQRSHSESDSELSVCNDSMDGDSINDGGGDT